MNYQCRLDIFEGPLDLLLHLIKEHKMDVYDIPIADITRQYLEYIDLLRELNLEIVGEYLIMAAELTRIKSRSLLPKPEVEEEGISGGEDPRGELTRRLLDYQRYRDAAFELRKREYDQQQLFTRKGDVRIEKKSEEDALIEANVFDLFSAFQKILKQKEFRKDYEVKITVMSVTERISFVLDILNASESITFESLFTPLNTKQEVIVTFLAILELMRLKLLRVEQATQFETIRLFASADPETQEAVLLQFHGSPESEDLP